MILECALIVLSLTWFIVWNWRKNDNLPPGPRGLPFLGFYPFLSNKPFEDFTKMVQKYGNVFSFRTIGGHLIVVLSGFDIIKEVLINRADEFTGRPKESNEIAWVSDGEGITQEDGEVWKEQRRFFLQTVKSLGFGRAESEPLIHEEVKTLIRDIKDMNSKNCDFKYHIQYAASSVVSQILFSRKFEKNGESFKEIATAATHLVEGFLDRRLIIVGLPYKIMMSVFPSTSRIRKAKKLYKRVMEEIIEEHIKSFDPNHIRDYIDGYLHELQKLEKSGKLNHSFIKSRMAGTSQNMLMEGTESVGGTIGCLLDAAAQYPEHQKLAQAELDAVVGRERLLSWSDRPKLPYLDAFIQELYRHNLPFNISTMYNNYKETTIQGYRIPKRTIIIANYYTTANDPNLFPDPSKFDPTRFLDETGKRKKLDGCNPFGIGKRSCIGESLAQMEVFIIIGSILQNFTLYATGDSWIYRVESR